jgi:hypothetical protein
MSRVYGGVHFEFSDNQGMATGEQIAQYVFDNAMTPVPEPGTLSLLASGLAAFAYLRARRRLPNEPVCDHVAVGR